MSEVTTMPTPIDFETPIAQRFLKTEISLGMAELHLSDKLAEGEKYHRWRLIKMCCQVVKLAIKLKLLSVDQLVGYIEKDRSL